MRRRAQSGSRTILSTVTLVAEHSGGGKRRDTFQGNPNFAEEIEVLPRRACSFSAQDDGLRPPNKNVKASGNRLAHSFSL